jgi:hypothetical protein
LPNGYTRGMTGHDNNTKGTQTMTATQINDARIQICLLNDERAYLKASRLDPIADDLGEIATRIAEIDNELARLWELAG